MSKVNKDLNIIVSCSFQNDFLEPLDNLSRISNGDNLKLDFNACQDMWLKYFKAENRAVKEATITQFIQWLKQNAKTQNENISLSYHKILEKYKHRVHIDYDETKRLWEGGKLNAFLIDLMKRSAEAFKNENSRIEYQCIHLKDWHDQTDIQQKGEIDLFGPHCLKGTYGAKFVSPLNDLIEQNQEFNIIINSNSLSSFDETNLESILNTILKNAGSAKNQANIGIFGVITNVKVLLLTFELMVIHKFKNVYICRDFCAGFNNHGHEIGINYLENIIGANVVNANKFREIFSI